MQQHRTMRKQTLQVLRNAATAAWREPTVTHSRYICSRCRKTTTARRNELAVINSSRSFATSSTHWHPTNTATRSSPASTSSSPESLDGLPQTHYDFFPETFPQGPPPTASFTPDLRQLRKEFLQLQAKMHPDLAPAGQKKHAEAMSMRINEAYKTLQDPLKRAQYLLAQQGVDVEDETAKLDDNALLMEVMEAREAVEEVEDEDGLVALRAENDVRIEDSVRALDEAFSSRDFETAAREAIKLRYWKNIEESIQGWEKGQGGGILHH